MPYWTEVLRPAAAALIDTLPIAASKFLVRFAALAHPSVKAPLFEHIFAKVAQSIGTNIEIIEKTW